MFYTIKRDGFGFYVFVRGFERRTRRSGGRTRRLLQPALVVGEYIADITPAEIGQLLGGN